MRLRSTLIAATVAGALGAAGPAITAVPAHAAGITECGNFHPTGGEAPYTVPNGYWDFRFVYGRTWISNLTTRGVRCSDAQRFSLGVTSAYPRYPQHGFRLDYWRTWNRYTRADVRLTRGSQVIHWQWWRITPCC